MTREPPIPETMTLHVPFRIVKVSVRPRRSAGSAEVSIVSMKG